MTRSPGRRAALSLLLAAPLAACVTNDIPTQRVDPRNDRTGAGMGLDNRDFQQAAQAMVRSMLASDRLQPRPDGRPRIMAISRITNDTTLRINTNELLQTIRRDLNNSGRITTTMAVGLDGAPDPLIMRTRELRQSRDFDQRTVAREGQMVGPEFSLSGNIIQRTTRLDGGAQRVDYIFQLTLANARNGLAVWEEEEVITRVGSGRTVVW